MSIISDQRFFSSAYVGYHRPDDTGTLSCPRAMGKLFRREATVSSTNNDLKKKKIRTNLQVEMRACNEAKASGEWQVSIAFTRSLPAAT